jgi:uncharacterized protein
MHIDITDILKENGFSKRVEVEFYAGDMGIAADDCEFGKPIALDAEITNINGIIRIKGRLCTEYKSFCARCLKPVSVELLAKIDEEYTKPDSSTKDDAYSYTGKSIVIDEVVNDAILLQIPIRHLCREDCKSLCPVCGKDLNDGGYGCAKTVYNEQFDILRGFFKENDETDR